MTESGDHTRSEAVYLDAVCDDGQWAMVARLCRYPQRGVQWAWLHVFAGAQVYSFTDHGIACDAAFTVLDAADALYEASAGDLEGLRALPMLVTVGARSDDERQLRHAAASHSSPSLTLIAPSSRLSLRAGRGFATRRLSCLRDRSAPSSSKASTPAPVTSSPRRGSA